MCEASSLPCLPLDRHVGPQYLSRRDAVSFASSADVSTAVTQPSLYLAKRRGAVAYSLCDRMTSYIRKLGDMKFYGDRCRERVERQSTSVQPYIRSRRSKSIGSQRPRMDSCSRLTRVRKMKSSKQTVLTLDTSMEHYTVWLSKIHGWGFDMFTFDRLTSGRSLFYISLEVFSAHDLIQTFHLDTLKLVRCISMIEDNYHASNPYHNAIHAADVTQAMHCFLLEQKISQFLTPMEKMVALLGAIVHDVDHPGVNQAFLIATANPLASLYENVSVLEKHHYGVAMAIFHETCLFSHLPIEKWSNLQETLRSIVLATDITRQQEFLTKFRKNLDDGTLDIENNADHRHFISQIALKCADVSNPCRPWQLSSQWSQRICTEFFRQSEEEQLHSLPVTPLCDKKSTTTAKIQLGFIDYIVSPLFTEWNKLVCNPLSMEMRAHIHTNKNQWLEEHRAHTDKDLEPEVTCQTSAGSLMAEGKIDLLNIPKEINDLLGLRRHSSPIKVTKYPVCYVSGRRHSMPTAITVRALTKQSQSTSNRRWPELSARSCNTGQRHSTSETRNAISVNPMSSGLLSNLCDHYDIASMRPILVKANCFDEKLPRRNSNGTIGSYSTRRLFNIKRAIETVREVRDEHSVANAAAEVTLPLVGAQSMFLEDGARESRRRSMSLGSGCVLFSKIKHFDSSGICEWGLYSSSKGE